MQASHSVHQTVKPIDPEEGSECDELLYRYFASKNKKGFLEVGDTKCVMPVNYMNYARRIENFEVFDTDVWVVSFPKCGSTWVTELVWCIKNNLNFEGAKQIIQERVPYFECSLLYEISSSLPNHSKIPAYMSDSFSFVQNLPHPRLIKTHLPWELLPKQIRDGYKKPKIIYIARNAKDACISNYNHVKGLNGYRGTFDTFARLFKSNRVIYGPFWPHVLTFWYRREINNIYFIRYESMVNSLTTVIHKVMRYLDRRYTDREINILEKHVNFESMKTNNAVNFKNVIKSIEVIGEVKTRISGSVTKELMSPAMIESYDIWSSENIAGCGLQL